ncbi:CPBP family intramembrane glutamic endopeptidase [Gordonia soli]|uniref:CAAX prenyl protease 2/Lysostaphin resistance protein A-like domain-containing protein n=1 Tax=Gordonia soli NBRC 108243 TaxID=1223545 RepID=M0QII8_9ACTN|nr:CPBP family intramembrane glutamic endopeptidase [Gordonia soli]GAC68348.1 hypothetical protein GS4_14_01810 [Gordonia soli NBRC 108243]
MNPVARQSVGSTRFRSHTTPVAPSVPRETRRLGVLSYVGIAFGGSWAALLVANLLGYSLDDPAVQLLTIAFAPAIAACIVRRWITGEGFADSGLRLRLRSNWRHVVAAVTIPWGMLALTALMAALVGLWTPSMTDMGGTEWIYLACGPLVCVALSPIFFGEEYGWTAYLRDRLVPGRPLLTTFLTGTIWGVWHWPLPWVGYFGGSTDVSDALWSMLWWIPLSILLEFMIGWLWAATGSVWPGTMLHAGSNMVASLGMVWVLGDSIGVNTATALLCVALTPFVLGVVIAGRWTSRPAAGGA